MDDIAIKVDHVSKTFKLPHEKQSSLKGALINFGKRGYEKQVALKDISFEVKKGEFFGIVGRNGSGKSTLLKLIAGIYAPDDGEIQVNGRLTPFIELGVGFNPDLSGRENVYLNGALLGFSRKEMEAMYDDIVEFAELRRFMDQKLKNYSSGMQVRLAFSIAIRANSDILVLDEVLAVGDEAFQRKCTDYFYAAKRNKKTVILVTHSMENVRQFCDRVILIDEGHIKAEGNPDKIAAQYSKMFTDELAKEIQEGGAGAGDVFESRGKLSVKELYIEQRGKKTKVVDFKKEFSVNFTFKAEEQLNNLVFAVHMVDQAGRVMMELSTRALQSFQLAKGTTRVQFVVENIYTEGEYYLNFAVRQVGQSALLVKEREKCRFAILGLNPAIYSKDSLTHPNAPMLINGHEAS